MYLTLLLFCGANKVIRYLVLPKSIGLFIIIPFIYLYKTNM